MAVKAEYSISFTEQGKRFCSSLHYSRSNRFLFVNGVKIYHFKIKDFELNAYPLCLGNISKDFSDDNMKQTGLNGYVYDFSVDYFSIDNDNILDLHKYLMKKTNIMFGLIKKAFIALLNFSISMF